MTEYSDDLVDEYLSTFSITEQISINIEAMEAFFDGRVGSFEWLNTKLDHIKPYLKDPIIARFWWRAAVVYIHYSTNAYIIERGKIAFDRVKLGKEVDAVLDDLVETCNQIELFEGVPPQWTIQQFK